MPCLTPGQLENWARDAAVWCSRCALVVAMEIANTAETKRKGTCHSSGACVKVNEKQVEFRIGPQLLVPHGVLISFPFLFLFQNLDWKQGNVIRHAEAPRSFLQPDISLGWVCINKEAWLIGLGLGAGVRRVALLLEPVVHLSLGLTRHLGICLQHMCCC